MKEKDINLDDFNDENFDLKGDVKQFLNPLFQQNVQEDGEVPEDLI